MLRLAVLVIAALAACAASADGAVTRSTPLPPLSSFALAPSDFHSATILSQSAHPDGANRQLYLRLFKPGAKMGSRPLLGAVSISIIDPDASTAAYDYGGFGLEAHSTSGRKAFAQLWSTDFVTGYKIGSRGKTALRVEHTVVGAPVALGSSALRLPMTMKTNKGSLRVSIAIVQVDRVVSIIELMGELNRPLDTGDSTTAVAAIRSRLRNAFTIANTAPPTIGGTPAVGQTLMVDEGRWTGAPSSFTYAWSRCNASGADCQPIPGATTNSYQVSTADAGSTLVVAVTGTNDVGSRSASSAPTAIPGS